MRNMSVLDMYSRQFQCVLYLSVLHGHIIHQMLRRNWVCTDVGSYKQSSFSKNGRLLAGKQFNVKDLK